MTLGSRILHVIPSVSPLRGGPSVSLGTMVRGLARAGMEVHVATTDDDGHGRFAVLNGAPAVKDGVTYRYFPRQTRYYTFSWPLTWWLARHTREYDLVHIHALFSYPALPAAYAAARACVPYVVRPLGTLNRWGMQRRHRRLKWVSFRMIERRILRGAACIHYTSEQERIEAAELGMTGRSVVVPLGVDLEPFEDLARHGWLRQRAPDLAGRTIILFLSRLDRKKGLDLLLDAFAQVLPSRPELALVIAGAGDQGFERALRDRATHLGVQDHVLWAGFLDETEKLAALADTDVFVLPSYSENFGMAVVEALASGLPVVVSDQVAMHRDIAAAGAGVVVPCDAEALAAALLRVSSDPALRAELGSRGRQVTRERFSIEAMTAGLLRLYDQVLDAQAAATLTSLTP